MDDARFQRINGFNFSLLHQCLFLCLDAVQGFARSRELKPGFLHVNDQLIHF